MTRVYVLVVEGEPEQTREQVGHESEIGWHLHTKAQIKAVAASGGDGRVWLRREMQAENSAWLRQYTREVRIKVLRELRDEQPARSHTRAAMSRKLREAEEELDGD